jgi:transposase
VNFSRDFFNPRRYIRGMSDDSLFPGVIDEPISDFRPAGPASAPRLRRVDRRQVRMMPRCLDELLPEDHQARLLWAVVGRLNVDNFLERIKARGEAPGRGANDPRVMITLWLYATTQGEGSAREVARLCVSHDAYRWICGGLSMNHHSLSDFRVDHAAALDELFTQVLASLVDKGLIDVHRISQDGTRVRAMAGVSSFASEDRLMQLLHKAKEQVVELKKQLADAPGLSARRKSAMERAAREKQERLEAALAQIPLMQAIADKPKNRAKSRRKEAKGKKIKASRTDPLARKMRMADGGTRPAYNVQLAVDTVSRALVGVDITNIGSDNAQSLEMRKQVQQRTGLKVHEHLVDGGFINLDHIEQSHAEEVAMYVPPPKRKDGTDPCAPRDEDTQGVAEWRTRMSAESTKEIYQERASTVETVNADLKIHRGLDHILVRGMEKVKTVVIWAGLAYNLMHFGKSLLS